MASTRLSSRLSAQNAAACQRVACRLPTRLAPQRRALAVARAAPESATIATGANSPARLRLLSSVAELCEVEGLTTKFEAFAGRSAMLGVSVALGIEALTEESLLAPVPDAQAHVLLALSVAAIVSASAVAAVQAATRASRPEAPVLLEPVISSLTAAQRAAATVSVEDGLTKDSIVAMDLAVDNVLATIFTRARLDWLTDEAFYVDID